MSHSLAVVIPTYKRIEDLRTCLASLELQVRQDDWVIEVIVSDDCPDFSAKAALDQEFPFVKFVQGPSRGPAANRNRGASQTSADWILFTDDDCIPSSTWISGYIKAITQCPEFKVFEGKTIADRPKRSHSEESPRNETGGYLWTCNIALRRDLFESMGGFDEGFPLAAMEDVDFRERLRLRGIPFQFVEGAVVIHPWRPKKPISFEFKKLETWLYYAKKHQVNPEGFFRSFFSPFRKLVKVIPGEILEFGLKGLAQELLRNLIEFWISYKKWRWLRKGGSRN